MPSEIRNLIFVDDLMREVMEALANGHAALVEKSESPIGTLAVKTADLTLDFSLSAKAEKLGESTRLQVKPTPFFGFSTEVSSENEARKVQLHNHAHLVLHIVNVAPLSVPTEQPGWNNGRSENESEADRKQNLAVALSQIHRFIHESHELRAVLARKLSVIDTVFTAAQKELTQGGSELSAQEQIRPHYGEVRKAILAQPNIRMVKDELAAIDSWLKWESAKDSVPNWQGRLKAPLTNLQTLVNGLPIPAELKGQFSERAEQVLASATEKEAAARLVTAITDLKASTETLTLPEDVRQTLDNIRFD